MLLAIFGVILIVFILFGTGLFFLSLLPEFIQDLLAFGCSCLIALVGLLIILVPIILGILVLIGSFCD